MSDSIFDLDPRRMMEDIKRKNKEEREALRDQFAAACLNKIGMFPQTLNLDLSGNMTEKQQAEFNKYIKASAKLAYQLADGMMEARNV
jgi:hypothetical protein